MFDSYPEADLQRAHVNAATTIIAAPAEGKAIVVLAFSIQAATLVTIDETGGSPLNLDAVNATAVQVVAAHNPVGWWLTRSGRGIVASAAVSGTFLYKVIDA